VVAGCVVAAALAMGGVVLPLLSSFFASPPVAVAVVFPAGVGVSVGVVAAAAPVPGAVSAGVAVAVAAVVVLLPPVGGAGGGVSAPPQAVTTADVPSRANAVAMVDRDKFGRIRISFVNFSRSSIESATWPARRAGPA
jgi:hypothetical protein